MEETHKVYSVVSIDLKQGECDVCRVHKTFIFLAEAQFYLTQCLKEESRRWVDNKLKFETSQEVDEFTIYFEDGDGSLQYQIKENEIAL